MTIDLFGFQPATGKPFRDIRNQRPSVAEEKAQLLMRLGVLINKVPPSVQSGSVNLTREWMREQERCRKVAKNSRASINDTSMAINTMQRFA